MENAVHLAVAGNVFDGVFCVVSFQTDVLDAILDLIQSVSEGFLPTFEPVCGRSTLALSSAFVPQTKQLQKNRKENE